MWLSVLGVYEWSGNNPLPPEMWLFPYLLHCHPGRVWCHCQMVGVETETLTDLFTHSDPFMLPIIGKRKLMKKILYW
ncbi:hypothetical protein CMV_003344 [Castanea mollissima]|uniref:Uncharacterized protein n=1 Tax=Castanea mollissima TaxID=60419 RepID=A0A8J4VV97_9ROSI|nr:hypothetical protein CMV_003344 [Castanea mollissima]